MSSYYPPGVGGSYRTVVEFRCENDACGTEHFEADATTELGMTYLHDEDEGDLCPECRRQGVEA